MKWLLIAPFVSLNTFVLAFLRAGFIYLRFLLSFLGRQSSSMELVVSYSSSSSLKVFYFPKIEDELFFLSFWNLTLFLWLGYSLFTLFNFKLLPKKVLLFSRSTLLPLLPDGSFECYEFDLLEDETSVDEKLFSLFIDDDLL